MRIGIMLRHLRQHGGGVLIYSQELLRALSLVETDHEFVLLCPDPRNLELDLPRERFRAVAVETPTRLLWDQVGVLRAAHRERLDVLFNPKYSVPLALRCPSVFVCHGLDWYVMPWGSRRSDRISHRLLVPRYTRKADAVICVSETARRHLEAFLGVPAERLRTIYLGVDEAFRKPVPGDLAERVRRRHGLPERFLLYCGQIYPPKNFGRLIRAFAAVLPELKLPLVVAGTHTWLCEDEIALIDELGVGPWVVRPGWIGREEIPAFYALADALVAPSLYEACPLPLLEAMASGCPILTADRHGCAELAGDAALRVDPEDVGAIAHGIRRLAEDGELRRELAERGRRRSQTFTWRRCAEQTLQVLEAAAAGG